ncbi:ABC transporter ATP-binding protein [Paenibacillus sp. YN15]|uniref:ABC transporter ATP-binding protein n=1 Tax=Paenibacillus sp. YN15 TaxID=1742774 RepID=UPI000DCD7E3E|nr:ABC transporter ATP-binding protein [Paenibacillus sp. YN15]RAV05433.1 ABC transporter ATP-binding protein [Paenibacillus sp. YN15]
MKHKPGHVVSNHLYMLRLAFRHTPGYVINICLLAVYSSVEVFFEFAYCTKYMIDLIQYNGEFADALRYMAFISAAIVAKLIWSAVNEAYFVPLAKEKLYRAMQLELFRKAAAMDLACYDQPQFYNEFVVSVGEAKKRMDESLEIVRQLCGRGATIAAAGTFFLVLDRGGLLFIAASLLVTLAVNAVLARLSFRMELALKPLQRKRAYISRIFYLADYAKEIRLNPIAGKLKGDLQQATQAMRHTIQADASKRIALGFIGSFAAHSLLLDALYLIYLLYRTLVLQALSYGSMLSLFNSAGSLKNSLRDIAALLPRAQQNSLYIDKIRAFADAAPAVGSSADALSVPSAPQALELRKVSFAYDESAGPILRDISLTIRQGEKIAFVGYNGAGKTTLTKLLMRLYDVSEGAILLDGVNIKEYELSAYRSSFGSVFQDYRLYAASIADNVMMDQADDQAMPVVRDALGQSGLLDRVNRMDEGVGTMVTREFSAAGTELSGGEAQKLAIARVFARPYPFIILDEPSSALDPISEYQFNQTVLEASRNKTVIFISHRLSSTRMADRIYMLEDGRIIEQGSHDELMAQNGQYARMFRMQACMYQSTPA